MDFPLFFCVLQIRVLYRGCRRVVGCRAPNNFSVYYYISYKLVHYCNIITRYPLAYILNKVSH
jgi:hypothetical protein